MTAMITVPYLGPDKNNFSVSATDTLSVLNLEWRPHLGYEANVLYLINGNP